MLSFAGSKSDYDEEKWIGITRCTWKKMSDDAHEFVLAGHTTLLPPLIGLIHKALE